jgi:O-antigen/teichoic acid export membrane protein
VVGAASVALNVGLNLILIPRYSYNGAASATVASETFVLVGLYFVARRHYEFQLEKTFLLRALGATAAAGGVVALLRSESPWLAVVAAELTFGLAAYAFKAVTLADMKMVLERRVT